MKNNIPPFYVGQKVVYITGKAMPKNSIHTVRGAKQHPCGCWAIDIGRKADTPLHVCYHHRDSDALFTNGIGWFVSESFRPLQEMKAPMLTFEKIKESEKEEVLILN